MLKRLLLAVLVLPFVVPLQAEPIFDALRLSKYDWTCVKVVNGKDIQVGDKGYTQQAKALAVCALAQAKDPKGVYEIVPSRYRVVLSSDAQAQLRASGFRVRIVPQDVTDPNQEGIVQTQDPAGGTQAPPGSTVTIAVGRFTGTTTGP